MATTRTHRLGTLLGVALALAAGAGAAPARAQATATVVALPGRECAGTRYGRDLGCNAKDFTTTATFTQPPPGRASCLAGETITLDVITNVTSNSPTRYDGAVFLGEKGNDPSLATLPAAGQTCSLGVFPPGPAPFLNLDADAIGDFESTGTASLAITGAVAYCVPAAGTNVLALPYTLVFDNSEKTDQTAATVTAGGPAKCVNTLAAQVTGVVVQGWVKLTVQTVPAGDAQPFSFTAGGSAAASPAAFALAAGQTQTIQIPLSPTGGTQTIQLDEALAPGWVSSAAIACTAPGGGPATYASVDGAGRRITATLDAANHGLECTITNTKLARVTVVEESAGATDTFTFSSGTNGLPPSFAVSTAAVNPASAGPWPVTANGLPVSISQTLPAGWTLASVSCSDGTSAVGTISGATVALGAAEITPGRNLTCTYANTRKAALTKAFSPASTGAGVPSTLTFTVTNRPGAPAQVGLGFTDAFPAGLRVASPLAVSSTCGGALYRAGTAIPLAAGDAGVTLSGGALAPGTASCTIAVAVSAPAVGTYTNGPLQLSGVAGGLESSVTDQTLTVYPLPNVLVVKSADRATARPGDVVTYTIVVQNTGAGVATGVVVSSTLPRDLVWAVDGFGPGVPFALADAGAGLALGTPVYSADGGATWALVPASGGGGAPAGYDGRVTAWRVPLVGTMAPGGQVTVTYRTAVR